MAIFQRRSTASLASAARGSHSCCTLTSASSGRLQPRCLRTSPLSPSCFLLDLARRRQFPRRASPPRLRQRRRASPWTFSSAGIVRRPAFVSLLPSLRPTTSCAAAPPPSPRGTPTRRPRTWRLRFSATPRSRASFGRTPRRHSSLWPTSYGSCRCATACASWAGTIDSWTSSWSTSATRCSCARTARTGRPTQRWSPTQHFTITCSRTPFSTRSVTYRSAGGGAFTSCSWQTSARPATPPRPCTCSRRRFPTPRRLAFSCSATSWSRGRSYDGRARRRRCA